MNKPTDLKDLKVTIMGLGLHGGGLASAQFCARHGANVTVTDLRSQETLEPTIEKLQTFDIHFSLGEHLEHDFTSADLVIKNPAVPPTSPFLRLAKRIETDISLFLRFSQNPLIAVTGSKGKSTTASAIHHVLKTEYEDARLGGNITVSPLTFLDEIAPSTPVILELSSWQLADIPNKELLDPDIAVITTIMPDHMDRYGSMQEYVNDKVFICSNQSTSHFTILNNFDGYGYMFRNATKAQVFEYTKKSELVPGDIKVPGEHNRTNLSAAALALQKFGVADDIILEGLRSFPGVPHRMEHLRTINEIDFYNDSAATIPQATGAAMKSFSCTHHLIVGGTDKNLDFSPLVENYSDNIRFYLLAGTAADKITLPLQNAEIPYSGPFNDLQTAVTAAFSTASAGEKITLSPGCASFGMFLNEFDRGRQFRKIVEQL